MSDVVDTAASAPVEVSATPEAPEPSRFGARLAWHREKAGLTVGDVAARLRLSVNHVRAIEAENLAVLPAIAYVRGFIRGYARAIGIDPKPLLDDLNARLDLEDRTGAPQGAERSAFEGSTDGRVTRRIMVVIGVLVLVALGAIGWNATSRLPVRSANAELPTPPLARQAPAAPDSASKSAPTPSKAETEAAPAATNDLPATSPVPTTDVVPAATAVAVPTTFVPSAENAPVSAANLSLVFDGPCWVEVTGADGTIVHSQLHPAGSQGEIAAPLPLSVVLGDGSKVRVAVKGKPFDLAPHMRQNVARFTVDR